MFGDGICNGILIQVACQLISRRLRRFSGTFPVATHVARLGRTKNSGGDADPDMMYESADEQDQRLAAKTRGIPCAV